VCDPPPAVVGAGGAHRRPHSARLANGLNSAAGSSTARPARSSLLLILLLAGLPTLPGEPYERRRDLSVSIYLSAHPPRGSPGFVSGLGLTRPPPTCRRAGRQRPHRGCRRPARRRNLARLASRLAIPPGPLRALGPSRSLFGAARPSGCAGSSPLSALGSSPPFPGRLPQANRGRPSSAGFTDQLPPRIHRSGPGRIAFQKLRRSLNVTACFGAAPGS
jgi:hypothetical protein